MRLSEDERSMLAGEQGEAPAIALRILIRLGEIGGARRMVPISSAHVGGLLYNGPSGLDFARHLRSAGARVAVPTTLNAGSVDLRRRETYRGDPVVADRAAELMRCYAEMGTRQTWTCAPYLLPGRPAQGEQVVWSESGAVVFANSVLGARTERYGSMTDICAAIVGRTPLSGLHLSRNRAARIVFRVTGVSEPVMRQDFFFQLLGYLVGERSGTSVAALEGLPDELSNDQLSALCAAAGTSGGLGMIHVVGSTPEARTRQEACQHSSFDAVDVTVSDLRDVHRRLGRAAAGTAVDVVCLGSPHLSLAEFRVLRDLLERAGPPHSRCQILVTTNRYVEARLREEGTADELRRLGVTMLTDVCSYNTRVLPVGARTVMTNSAKWAHYGPGNHGLRVLLGSTWECVMTARHGQLWRDGVL